jgi:hypothetical protein
MAACQNPDFSDTDFKLVSRHGKHINVLGDLWYFTGINKVHITL